MNKNTIKGLGKNQQLVLQAWEFGFRTSEEIQQYTGLNKTQVSSCIGSLFTRGLLADQIKLDNDPEVILEVRTDCILDVYEEELENATTQGYVAEDLHDAFNSEKFDYIPDSPEAEAQVESLTYYCYIKVLETIINNSVHKKVGFDLGSEFEVGVKKFQFSKDKRVREALATIYSTVATQVMTELHSTYAGGYTKEEVKAQKKAHKEEMKRQQEAHKEKQRQEQDAAWKRAYEEMLKNFNGPKPSKEKIKAFAVKIKVELCESDKVNYRRMAKKCHPDAGGSHELMTELNNLFGK